MHTCKVQSLIIHITWSIFVCDLHIVEVTEMAFDPDMGWNTTTSNVGCIHINKYNNLNFVRRNIKCERTYYEAESFKFDIDKTTLTLYTYHMHTLR